MAWEYTLDPHEVFWQLHEGLRRQAPGSELTTARLLQLAEADEGARVLDIGCGSGAASIQLAEAGLHVTAVDDHQPFLEALDSAWARRAPGEAGTGRAGTLQTRNATMQDLPFRDASFDLVWAEGSAYVMGFDRALAAWRRLLRPGGAIVLTECEYTVTEPPGAVRTFWDAAYPAMRTTADNVLAAQRAGWHVRALYTLPDRDWWLQYYDEIERRASVLLSGPGVTDSLIADTVRGELAEIELRRAHPDAYGYTGYVLGTHWA